MTGPSVTLTGLKPLPHAAKDDSELLIFLPHLFVSSTPALGLQLFPTTPGFVVLKIEPRTLCVVDEDFTTQPSSNLHFFVVV